MRIYSFNKKSVFVFVFIVVVISLLAGFYFWAKNTPASILLSEKIVYSGVSDYEIKDTINGKIIENKKEGLIAKVPDGWSVKDIKAEDESGIGIYDQNVKFNEKDKADFKSFMENGACAIEFAIMKYLGTTGNISTSADIIKNHIKGLNENPNQEANSGFYLDKVDGKDALRQVIDVKNKGYRLRSVMVQVPIGQKIYEFATSIFLNDKCLADFDSFLKTIIISK